MRKIIIRVLVPVILLAFIVIIVFFINLNSTPICPELNFSDSVFHKIPSPAAEINIQNPYTGGKLYRGQLHTHTNRSDGALTPAELALLYRDAGYDFLSITDHGSITPGPDIPGILSISGTEIGTSHGHMVLLGIRSKPFEGTPFTSYPPAQKTIDYVIDSHGLSGLAHPAAGDEWANSEIHSLSGFTFIEACSDARVAEDKWDYALNQPSLRKAWGLAVDDFHIKENFNRGWVMVFAEELTTCNVLQSLASGNFYATQGPDISISVSKSVITITTSQSSTIIWKAYDGILKTDKNTMKSVFKSNGTERYVRIVVIRDSDSRKAWSQPLFIY